MIAALAAILLAAAGPDPATLKGALFAPAADVERFRAGAWSASDPANDYSSVKFVRRGRIVVDGGTERETCNFSSSDDGGGGAWSLDLDCSVGAASWTWLSADRVRTDLINGREMELLRFDRDFHDLDAMSRLRYRLASLRRLSGPWEDAASGLRVILAPALATLAGAPAKVDVEPCQREGDAEGSPSTCLLLRNEAASLMLVEQGGQLLECNWESTEPGYAWDPTACGRALTRPRKPGARRVR